MMDEEEKKLLLAEIDFLRAKAEKAGNKEKGSEIKSAEDYLDELRMFGDTPKDQFAHQFRLLFHPQAPPKTQMDLLPPDALLGLVKDSKTHLLLQNDNAILNRLYDMGTRNEGIMELFNSLFYSWWQQMRLTGTLGATERWLQSFLEPQSIPYEGFTYLEKRQAKKTAKQQGIAGIMKQMQSNIGGRTYV